MKPNVQKIAEKVWRPISEIHEDYGPCILIHIDDPGGVTIGTNLDVDFLENEWTHFARLPDFTNEMIADLRALAEAVKGKKKCS